MIPTFYMFHVSIIFLRTVSLYIEQPSYTIIILVSCHLFTLYTACVPFVFLFVFVHTMLKLLLKHSNCKCLCLFIFNLVHICFIHLWLYDERLTAWVNTFLFSSVVFCCVLLCSVLFRNDLECLHKTKSCENTTNYQNSYLIRTSTS